MNTADRTPAPPGAAARSLTASELIDRLRGRGFAGAVAGVERLPALRAAICGQVVPGGLDPQFVQERLGFFDFEPPSDFPGAASLIVTAIPLSQSRVWFHWRGRRFGVLVPPGYIGFDQAGRRVQEVVAGILTPAGYRVAPVLLPEKLIAACTGLAMYGANNVVYVPGMGSLLRLVTFFSDLPPGEAAWHAPKALPRCGGCNSCARACPTGAIEAGRFLLHAERCLVFHNERPGTIPFPEWIPAGRHECLVGCMECQRACPENRLHLGTVEDAGEFSERDTGIILEGRPEQDLPSRLAARLRGADLMAQYAVLARNLRAVLEAASTT